MVTERRPAQGTKTTARRKRTKQVDTLAYLLRMSEQLPADEVARMPRDLAYNFDHYHDGSPKQR
jgi:hypothetical protein